MDEKDEDLLVFCLGEHTLRERWDVQMGECGKMSLNNTCEKTEGESENDA